MLSRAVEEYSSASKESESSLDTPPLSLSGELQCSVCLDVFTDPVTTPCGHNFCKNCLIQCWSNSQTNNCPNCREPFGKRPDLKINTALREVAQYIKGKSGQSNSEVLCDICDDDVKMKALKMCLVCQSSYCETHLEPHQRVQKLKRHKLIDPVENLEKYMCQKHGKPLEMFCRNHQTCVCLLCTVTDHKNHNTVAVEEESQQRKPQMKKMQADVQQLIQEKMKKMEEIRQQKQHGKESSESEKSESMELFTDLIRSIERCQSELLEMMEQKQKAAEKQAEDMMKELEQEITDLKRRNTELEQLSDTEDHLRLLQIYPSLSRPTHTSSWTDVNISDTQLSVETVREKLTQLQKILDEKLQEILHEKLQETLHEKLQETLHEKLQETPLEKLQESLGTAVQKRMPIDAVDVGLDPGTVTPFPSTAQMTMQRHAVDVTLDPDTAHPNLILSNDGKQVSYTDIMRALPDNPRRFDFCPCVLGKEGFSSGRFYFEVQVKGKSDWDLGVARESINRKGAFTGTPENGFWIIMLRNNNDYLAVEPLSLRVNPQVVGVFVDYEKGLVSFYDVESNSEIHSFTGQTFTEKLFPYFSPFYNNHGRNVAPLVIREKECFQ